MEIKVSEGSLSGLKNWFSNYVYTFKNEDNDLQQNIDLKKEHTRLVCKDIVKIGKQLNLNDDELRMAEIIALFHDVGRFEQYARYRTFMDRKSIDHAELGTEILKKHDVLKQFDEEIKELILSSIRYHNQPMLPQNLGGAHLFYSQLIRDADKLDIFRIVTSYYKRENREKNEAVILGLPDTPGISEEVYQNLINRKIVNVKYVKNLNDLKLLQTGWIYDINFRPTVDFIKSNNYLEKMHETLPGTKEINEIFEVIHLFCSESGHIENSFNNFKTTPENYISLS